MYDAGKIIPGLIIFLGLAAFPIWYGVASGAPARPQLPIATQEKQCVESAEFMRAYHMTMLNSWRDQVVREGQTTYISTSYGTKHAMSLTESCLSCHSNKEEFCDRCHDYTQVEPGCWDCHVVPEEKKA